jgi:hypothetical protein
MPRLSKEDAQIVLELLDELVGKEGNAQERSRMDQVATRLRYRLSQHPLIPSYPSRRCAKGAASPKVGKTGG